MYARGEQAGATAGVVHRGLCAVASGSIMVRRMPSEGRGYGDMVQYKAGAYGSPLLHELAS